jgi:hypothetical protein
VLAGVLAGAAIPVHAFPPAHFWSKRFGDSGEQQGQGVVVDASGNIILAANFYGAVDFGGGILTSSNNSQDFVIAKYTSMGAHVWSKRLGGASYDDVRGIGVDPSGNIFVAGYNLGTTNLGGVDLPSAGSDDIFLGKFDSSGNHIWSKRFGSTGFDVSYGMAVDNLGYVLITGSFEGSVSFGVGTLVSAGGDDIYLAKFDPNGTHAWSTRFGSTQSERGYSVAVDGSLYPVFTGYMQGTVDFGGGALNPNGGYDIFLVKLDANGNHYWSKSYGGINFDFGYGVATNSLGDVLTTGSFNGTMNMGGSNLTSTSFSDDIYLARYTSTGVHVWSKRLGGGSGDFGMSAALDGSGNAVLAGMFSATVDFGGGNLVSAGSFDVVLAKYDATGAHVWSRRSGGANADGFNLVTTDAPGDIVTTGRFGLTANFGGANLVSAGGNDVYLAKYGSGTEQPVITSITDVGNDQGRQVNIRFTQSGHDKLTSPTPVTQYEAYRRYDAPPSLVARDPAGQSTPELLADGWTFAGLTPAHAESAYRIDAPTIGDSTIALGQYHSVFYIRAATASAPTFFDSPIDSGYSLDNLAPGVPQNFVFNAGQLAWTKSSAGDFDYFTVYGSNTDAFGAATVVDYSVAPALDVNASPYVYYYVTASDFSGNEGQPAKLNTLSGVGGTPNSYVLSVSNYPNPFNPRTTVSYTAPSRGAVTIAIFDLRGARIATLVNNEERAAGAYSVQWDGRGDNGVTAASGVYFARIEHASGTRSKKMVLLK